MDGVGKSNIKKPVAMVKGQGGKGTGLGFEEALWVTLTLNKPII